MRSNQGTFSLLALEHPQVIHDGGGRLIHAVSQSVRVPDVLLLRKYDRIILGTRMAEATKHSSIGFR